MQWLPLTDNQTLNYNLKKNWLMKRKNSNNLLGQNNHDDASDPAMTSQMCSWICKLYLHTCRCQLEYWNKVTVHHLKLCYFLMKIPNTMICGVLLNHCLTVTRIISKSVCLDTLLRDTSLKPCGVKSQFTNSVSCVSIMCRWCKLDNHASSLSSLHQRHYPVNS